MERTSYNAYFVLNDSGHIRCTEKQDMQNLVFQSEYIFVQVRSNSIKSFANNYPIILIKIFSNLARGKK